MTIKMLGKRLRCYRLEAGHQLLSLWRLPAFALPTLLFPMMFYLFFGLLFDMGGSSVHMPTYLLATFGTFGVMAPALFGFGVSVAGERGEGWLRLKRASPMPPGAYLGAKLASTLVFALAVVLALFSLGALFGEVALPREQWLLLALVLTLGSLPFCALGLAIGLRAGTQAAPAIVNMIYLPLAFLSGLWVPVQAFPAWLQDVAPWLPPYHLAQLALQIVDMTPRNGWPVHVSALGLFSLLFGWLALRGWYRMKQA